MTNATMRWVTGLTALATAVAVAACGGGGSSPTGSTPTQTVNATPTPVAAASATPRPEATPTPDPRSGLAPGPVFRYTIKVRTINNGERDAVEDSDGGWLVGIGDRVDFDSTQKNVNNEICTFVNTPRWFINGVDMAAETSNG